MVTFKLSKHGFSTIEAIAAILIISLVLITAVTITINLRNQTIATEKRFEAVEVGTRIRTNISSFSNYNLVKAWLDETPNQEVSFNLNTCDAALFDCDVIFNILVNDTIYDDEITIIFPQVNDSVEFRIIHYQISIVYYESRDVIIEGMIYDTYQ